MKKVIIILFLLLLPLNIYALSSDYKDVIKNIINEKASEDKVNIYLFYGDGCPHCENELLFLNVIKEKYGDKVEIFKYETWYNDNNLKLMKKAKEYMKEEISGTVPFTIIGEKSFVGYSNSYSEKMEKQIMEYLDIQLLPDSLHPVILGFIFSTI